MANALKFAAWAGVISLAASFFIGFFGSFFQFGFLNSILVFLMWVAPVVFYYGFFVLGKKYKNGLLKGFSLYFMIITVFFVFLMGFLSVYYSGEIQQFLDKSESVSYDLSELEEQYGGEENIPEDVFDEKFEDLGDMLMTIFYIMLIFHFGFFIFYGIPSIFLGAAIMKLENRVDHAKVTGIVGIVGGATTIIFIGYLIGFASYIMQILILFNESGKIKRP